jgi:hypothetical protein
LCGFHHFLQEIPRIVSHSIKLNTYIVMSWDQTARRSYSMKIDNSSFERVEGFKYLGTTRTNQNSIKEEIKSRLKSGNACSHLVQNILCSRLLSKSLKNYNFACCFVWVWNLVADIEGGT